MIRQNPIAMTEAKTARFDSLLGRVLLIGLIYTLLSVGSLYHGIRDENGHTMDLAVMLARITIAKDVSFRQWASLHGGVYVPTNERTPPNSYLLHIPDRDIRTPSGERLTLMNPAYMMRQVMGEYSDQYGTQGRITSLKPLNPANAPDGWEEKALRQFETGVKEVMEEDGEGVDAALRLMRPMYVQEGCLKCHGQQGYKLGDVRGGVGVKIPLRVFREQGVVAVRHIIFVHAAFWGTGMVLLGLYFRLAHVRQRERSVAEQILRFQERQMREILNHASSVIFLKDVEGRYLFVNRQYEEVFHVSNESMQGRSDCDLFSAEVATAFQANDRQVLEGGKPLMSDEVVPQEDGEHVYFSVKFPLLDENGRIYAVCGIATDITGRKQMEVALQEREERLRLTHEHALDAIITIDVHGLVEEFNPAAELLFGYSKEFMMGRDLAEYIIPHEFRQAHKKALQFHASHQDVWINVKRTLEMPGLNSEGYVIDLEVGLISVTLVGKRYYTAFLRDVTARKQLLKSLQETLDVAESANRIKSEFLANMSHELRTPMNAIIGITDLLLTTSLSREEQQNNLEIVLQSSQQLLELLNNILDFSKIDSGMIVLEHIPFDLSGQIENVLNTLALKAHQKDLELYCNMDDRLPLTVVGDPLRFRQVLVNLVNNAIKFTQEGEIVVRVEPVSSQSDEEIRLLFSVSDTGIGIPGEKMASIFDRFTQVDGSITRKYGGSGLGLTISRHLVLLMDGEMGVESRVGQGSVFHFTACFGVGQRLLPGMMGAGVDARQYERVCDDQMVGKRVLLVDGHATGRQIVKRLLSACGCEVEEVSDLRAMMQVWDANQVRQHAFDLLVLDFAVLQADGSLSAELQQWQGAPDKVILLLPFHVSLATFLVVEWLKNARSVGKPVFKYRLLKAVRSLLGIESEEQTETVVERSVVMRQRVPLDILLVEDNLNNQKLATIILTQAGHMVTVANHGLEALACLREKSYDLVLMDLHMPEMDGMEATRQIRSNASARVVNPRVPIIAVTAKAVGDEEKECLDAGMDGYLRKPYRNEDLLRIIDRVLRKRQQDKSLAVGKGKKMVLKPVDLDPVVFSEESHQFIADLPNFMRELERAVADRNPVQVSKWVNLMNQRARVIGAMNVLVQGMRLRGHAEQKNWEDARMALNKLVVQCQEVREALSIQNGDT